MKMFVYIMTMFVYTLAGQGVLTNIGTTELDEGVRRGVLRSGAHLSHRTHARKKLSSTRQPLPAWQSRRVDAHREQAVQPRVSARLHDAGAQLARTACTA